MIPQRVQGNSLNIFFDIKIWEEGGSLTSHMDLCLGGGTPPVIHWLEIYCQYGRGWEKRTEKFKLFLTGIFLQNYLKWAIPCETTHGEKSPTTRSL